MDAMMMAGAKKQKTRKFWIFGGVFTGIGGLGAFGVCHTICQAAVVGLAAMGITIFGMPFAFLSETWFVVLSFVIGALFIGAAVVISLKHQEMQPKLVRSSGHDCCQVKPSFAKAMEGKDGEKNEA